jgi:dienelactone hydrolase
MYVYRRYIVFWAISFICNNTVFAQTVEKENLDVFQKWIKWNNPGSLLINHLLQQADSLYEKRYREIAQLKTEEDWINRQKTVKGKLISLFGKFPDKTPLHAKTTGVIKKKGYRIEKVIFESMPGFYVTGCLYLPDIKKDKLPAVLNPIGHDQETYRNELYQIIITNLVKKGIIVFAYDPLGQGERVQYYDEKTNFSSVGYSVIEHCYFGNQCFISGISPAKYFVWDGIRAIDYLLSRKEVDAQRIGVTGFSGGGTTTSFLAAVDERVSVSVLCSWSTASRRQLESRGTQDAETVLAGSLAQGITFEDLLEVRAPKPTLMTFTSRDQYLSLQGARESFKEAKKVYESFDEKDNIELAEDDTLHWVTPKLRNAIYTFFIKHFKLAAGSNEENTDLLSESELKALYVTTTGQVATSLNGASVFDVNKKETLALLKQLNDSRKDTFQHLLKVVNAAKKLSGYNPAEGKPVIASINGQYRRNGYSITKFALQGSGNYLIPVLLFSPGNVNGRRPAFVYCHEKGKVAEAATGQEIEALVRKGYIVAAVDVLGTGEITNTATRSFTTAYTAVLTGNSIVGIQAGDIVRTVRFLKERSDIDSLQIGAIAYDEMCIPMLHAVAFDASINRVVLNKPLISYSSVALSKDYKIGIKVPPGRDEDTPKDIYFSWGIAGVLTAYDLPDLIACIAPRKIIFINIRQQLLNEASTALIEAEFAFPFSVYASRNAVQNINIFSNQPLHKFIEPID